MAMTDKGKSYSVLTMNTLAFTVNFAIWTMFSIIGIRIKGELGLNETEFGLLVATPILTGSLVRLPLGVLTDRYGGRIVFFIQMLLVAIPTYGLAFAHTYWQYLVIGLFVGLAGGSFAVGIAYTSAWFPKKQQGTAMGIFGAGNAGAAVTNLAAPLIVVAFGWRAVPQVYSIAMLVMAVLFWFFTYPDPKHEERKLKNAYPTIGQQLAPLTEARVWRFGLAYYFVFGGFVALALWLPKYYMGQYGLSLKSAAFITMLFTLPSGVIRALGGWVSDRWGGATVTWWVFWVCIICLFFLAYPPTTLIVHGIKGDVSVEIAVGVTLFTVLVFIVGMAQGIGKASVYRSLADYYPDNMGSVGGLVGGLRLLVKRLQLGQCLLSGGDLLLSVLVLRLQRSALLRDGNLARVQVLESLVRLLLREVEVVDRVLGDVLRSPLAELAVGRVDLGLEHITEEVPRTDDNGGDDQQTDDDGAEGGSKSTIRHDLSVRLAPARCRRRPNQIAIMTGTFKTSERPASRSKLLEHKTKE